MKLSSIIADPTLASTSSRSKYQYEIMIRGQKKICQSHVETVITTLKLLADEKIIDLSEIECSEKIAGFHLILDVSDLEAGIDIANTINTEFPKFKNRYQCKKLLTVGESKYIVCREWTSDRVDKFIEKYMSIANTGIDAKKNKKDLCSVTRM